MMPDSQELFDPAAMGLTPDQEEFDPAAMGLTPDPGTTQPQAAPAPTPEKHFMQQAVEGLANMLIGASQTGQVAAGKVPGKEIAMTGSLGIPGVETGLPGLLPGMVPQISEKLPALPTSRALETEADRDQFWNHQLETAKRWRTRVEGRAQATALGAGLAVGTGVAVGAAPVASPIGSVLAGIATGEAMVNTTLEVEKARLLNEYGYDIERKIKADASRYGYSPTDADIERVAKLFEDPRSFGEIVGDVAINTAAGTAIGGVPVVAGPAVKKIASSALKKILPPSAIANLTDQRMKDLGLVSSARMLVNQGSIGGAAAEASEALSLFGKGNRRTTALEQRADELMQQAMIPAKHDEIGRIAKTVDDRADALAAAKARAGYEAIRSGEYSTTPVTLTRTQTWLNETGADASEFAAVAKQGIEGRIATKAPESAQLREALALSEQAVKDADQQVISSATARKELEMNKKELAAAWERKRKLEAEAPVPSKQAVSATAAKSKELTQVNKKIAALNTSKRAATEKDAAMQELLAQKARLLDETTPSAEMIAETGTGDGARVEKLAARREIEAQKIPVKLQDKNAAQLKHLAAQNEKRMTELKLEAEAAVQRQAEAATQHRALQDAASRSSIAGKTLTLADAWETRNSIRAEGFKLARSGNTPENLERGHQLLRAADALTEDLEASLNTIGSRRTGGETKALKQFRALNREYGQVVSDQQQLKRLFDANTTDQVLDTLIEAGKETSAQAAAGGAAHGIMTNVLGTSEQAGARLQALKNMVHKVSGGDAAKADTLWSDFRGKLMHRIAMKADKPVKSASDVSAFLSSIRRMENNGTFKVLFDDSQLGKDLSVLAALEKDTRHLFGERNFLQKVLASNIALKVAGLSGMAASGTLAGGAVGGLGGAIVGAVLAPTAFDSLINSRPVRQVLINGLKQQNRILRQAYLSEFKSSWRQAMDSNAPLSDRVRAVVSKRAAMVDAQVTARMTQLARQIEDPATIDAIDTLLEEPPQQ